jgi:phage terminase large subunit-like protein
MPRLRAKKTEPEETRAEHNIRWCEKKLFIPEGKHVGEPLEMAEFMKEDFRAIYDNEHGPTRRAIISRGRKNAKSFEAACIILLHLCGPEAKSRVNSQLYSTALSRDQASLVFGLAAKMVRMHPDLRAVVAIRETQKALVCPRLGTSYRALSADAGTNFGLSPALVIHDELGQVRGARSSLYEALETATAAQAEPLSVIISTQAPTDADLLPLLIDDALARNDPRVTCSLFTAPLDDDPFAIKTIKKANPAYGDFLNTKEVLDMAKSAKRMPAGEASYRNLILNQRVDANQSFVSRLAWNECGAPVNHERLKSVALYGGLDLSAVTDLTALVLIGEIDEVYHCWPTFWLPEEGLREKSQKDRVPYDLWHREGHLQTTPGSSVSYVQISEPLTRSAKNFFSVFSFLHSRVPQGVAPLSEVRGGHLRFPHRRICHDAFSDRCPFWSAPLRIRWTEPVE